MKLYRNTTLILALTLAACSQPPEPDEQTTQVASGGSMDSAGAMEEGGSMDSTGAIAPPAHSGGVDLAGQVLETMASGGYTYVLLETSGGQVWAAGMAHNLNVGDQVVARGLTPMKGFTSATLDRTFEEILFCDSMMATGAKSTAPAALQVAETPVKMEIAAGGQTVEQMFTETSKFAGKPVTLRGKVVKFSAAIMGKNWIHLQDGSGGSGTNDLTITTAQTVAVGDTVTVQGALVVDKDFGYGYKYAVIIEDAKVTVE